MASSAFNWIKTSLAAIGAMALVAAAVLGGLALYKGDSSTDRRDAATPNDVLYILNWAGIPSQDFAVAHSFQSARSFTGDHVDGYCILLKQVTLDSDWLTPATLDKPFLNAVAFGLDFAANELPCLPPSSELVARKILIKPFSLRFNATQPGAGELILLDPARKELYFVSFKV